VGRAGINRSHSPSRIRGEVSRPSERDYIADSQAAAFAAIDQSILARRIGPPTEKKVEPIPLKFDKDPMPEPEDTDKTAEEPPTTSEDGSAAVEGEATDTKASEPGTPTTPTEQTASVSHIITNVIILQSFLLELTSLLQVRAGLFEEVRFI
jgi:hypothetical protein